MNAKEQAAFVEAYAHNLGYISKDIVASFVARYVENEDFEYSYEHISIMDALGIWHDAIKFHINLSKEAQS